MKYAYGDEQPQSGCVKQRGSSTMGNRENIRRWVNKHSNVIKIEIDYAHVCFMGHKSMRKDFSVTRRALSW